MAVQLRQQGSKALRPHKANGTNNARTPDVKFHDSLKLRQLYIVVYISIPFASGEVSFIHHAFLARKAAKCLRLLYHGRICRRRLHCLDYIHLTTDAEGINRASKCPGVRIDSEVQSLSSQLPRNLRGTHEPDGGVRGSVGNEPIC
jgi:hypothetical protein